MTESAAVMLGPLEPSDVDELYQWINHREDVLFSSAYRPVHRAQHEEWFGAVTRRPDAVIFAIRQTATGKLLGTCQLVDIHPVYRSGELRIRIGEPGERGRGVGTQAVEHLLRFGFQDLNLHRIWLQVFSDNARAVRVYEKLGFREEGLLRDAAYVDGRYKSIRILALLRDDYDRCHPPA